MWVALQLDHLCKQRSDHDLRHALRGLPKGLNETYVRSLSQIDALGPGPSARCRLVLQWIIGAKIPLQLTQLAEAVALSEMDNGCWQPDRIVNDPRALIDDCAGLCSLGESGAQLIHASVKDFLCHSGPSKFPQPFDSYRMSLPQLHLRLAEICCQYAQVSPASDFVRSAWPYSNHRRFSALYPSVQWHAIAVCDTEDLSEAELQRLVQILSQNIPNPLTVALTIRYHGENVARALVQKGFDPNARDRSGQTHLHSAAKRGLLEMCSVLLECGASAVSVDFSRRSPMHMIRNTPSIIALLLNHKGDIFATTHAGETPLHYAAESGSVAVCRELLDRGADPNCCDQNNATPLHLAAKYRASSGDVAELLLARGASVDASDKFGQTPLHSSAVNAQIEQASILLDYGAEAKKKDCLGRTPLHLAFSAVDAFDDHSSPYDERQNRLALGFALLSRGADPCSLDKDGATPLHRLAETMCRAGRSDDPCLAAIAFLSAAVPNSFGILDSQRRSVEAFLRRSGKHNHRLSNLILRLRIRDAALPTLGTRRSPAQFYYQWLEFQKPMRRSPKEAPTLFSLPSAAVTQDTQITRVRRQSAPSKFDTTKTLRLTSSPETSESPFLPHENPWALPHTTQLHAALAFNQPRGAALDWNLASPPSTAALDALMRPNVSLDSVLTEPATNPPLPMLKIVLRPWPYTATVIAWSAVPGKPVPVEGIYVTVGDVIDTLYSMLRLPISRTEFASLSNTQRYAVARAYTEGVSHVQDARMRCKERSLGVKRIDTLIASGCTQFVGLKATLKGPGVWALVLN